MHTHAVAADVGAAVAAAFADGAADGDVRDANYDVDEPSQAIWPAHALPPGRRPTAHVQRRHATTTHQCKTDSWAADWS